LLLRLRCCCCCYVDVVVVVCYWLVGLRWFVYVTHVSLRCSLLLRLLPLDVAFGRCYVALLFGCLRCCYVAFVDLVVGCCCFVRCLRCSLFDLFVVTLLRTLRYIYVYVWLRLRLLFTLLRTFGV